MKFNNLFVILMILSLIIPSLIIFPNNIKGTDSATVIIDCEYDTIVDSFSATTNYANETTAEVAPAPGVVSQKWYYLWFDISGYVSPYINVLDVTLDLYQTAFINQGLGANATEIHAANSMWEEDTLIWNNKPSLAAVNNYLEISSGNYWHHENVTEIYEPMMEGLNPYANYGICVGEIDMANTYRWVFATSENSNETLRPHLHLTIQISTAIPYTVLNVSPLTGISPLTINASGYGSLLSDAYNWNWGDDTSTYGGNMNETHEYHFDGIYVITLTCVNEYGSDSETKTITVNVGDDNYEYAQMKNIDWGVIFLFIAVLFISIIAAMIGQNGFSPFIFMSAISINFGLLVWRGVLPIFFIVISVLLIILMLYSTVRGGGEE